MAAMSTLTDTFTTTLDSVKWSSAGDGTSTIDTNRLKLTPATTAFSAQQTASVSTYDITNDKAALELDPGAEASGWGFWLWMNGPGSNNFVRMGPWSGGIRCQVYNANVEVYGINFNPYSKVTHKWIRVRHASVNNTFYFETSPDGADTSWTTVASSAAHNWLVTTMSVRLVAQPSSAITPAPAVYVDNFNNPPLATSSGQAGQAWMAFFDIAPQGVGSGAPSGGGTPLWDSADDFDWLHWDPGNNGYPIPENSSFHTISTPSGPGFEVVCTDALNQAAWNPGSRAVLTQKDGTCALGRTEDWTWDSYLPTQVFNVTPYCLWEFHTGGASSGHLLDVTTSNFYRLVRQTGPLQDDYTVVIGPAIVFDTWTPIRIQVRWSLSTDGFIRMWIGGAQYMNFSGQTWFEGEPHVQFGYYGVYGGGLTNTVRFGNIQRAIS